MRRLRRFATVVASASAVAGALPATAAAADPSPPASLTYAFTGCTGPAGTPAAFDAVKQPGGAAGLRLTDGSAVFVLMEAVDAATGTVLFATPGLLHNGLPTVG